MKKLVLGVFIVFVSSVYSQFDAQLSQYMFHANAFNPAAVGESNLIEVIGQHRLNMVSMPGGGSTTAFSLNTPIKIGKNKSGLGLVLWTIRWDGLTINLLICNMLTKQN